MSRFHGPVRLETVHDRSAFTSGVESLDYWLKHLAQGASKGGSAQTFVITDSKPGRVVGYYALTSAEVSASDATDRAARGMPATLPAVLLARLAVDLEVQGLGLGAELLADAMKRAVSVSEQVGIRLMLVHALNESAADFYLKFGFEPSPTNPRNLQALLKDIRLSLDQAIRDT